MKDTGQRHVITILLNLCSSFVLSHHKNSFVFLLDSARPKPTVNPELEKCSYVLCGLHQGMCAGVCYTGEKVGGCLFVCLSACSFILQMSLC